jgi:hypothetical protein
MSRIVPLPTTNTVVDNTVAIINANGTVASFTGGGAAAPYADQQVVTASAVALTTQALSNGVLIRAKPTNAGTVFVGGAGVTATNDGTGNGFALAPGEAVNLPVNTTAGIFIIGTLNDVVYVIGS